MTVSHINYNNHLTADQSPRQFLLPVLTIYQQMDWDTTINLDGFGNSAQMEWQTVKSWQSFANFFDDAVHIDAVTYCESPELLLPTRSLRSLPEGGDSPLPLQLKVNQRA